MKKKFSYKLLSLALALCLLFSYTPTTALAASYSVTYNANGGSGSPPSDTNSYSWGQRVTVKDRGSLTRVGYEFAGWETSIMGTDYNPGDTFLIYTNIALNARWTPNTYTVVYNINGGTGGTTNSSAHTYDDSERLRSNGFNKTGYSFAGWATSPTGNVVYADRAWVENLTTVNGGTVNLYAKWTANTYTVSYDKNSNQASGTTASSTHTYDVAKNLTPNGYSRSGYIFAGWATTQNGNVVYADQASVINLDTDGTFRLYAKWTQIITSTISYDLNGGSVSPANPTSFTNADGAITLNNPTRANCTFTGWTGTGLSEKTMTVTIPAGSSGDRSYAANWAINGITVNGYDNIYDGAAHGVTVNGTLPGDAVTYSLNGTNYVNDNPLSTNVTPPGGVTVYVKVTRADADPFMDTAIVKITPTTMTVTAVGYTGTYDAAAHEGIVSTTKSMEAATLSYSTDGENYDSAIPTFTNAGSYTVHVKATLANYADATTTATVTIDKATMTVTAVGYTGTYDAAAHEGVVSTTKSMEAATLSYSTDGENYDSAIPTFTNAGAYTVHVKATLANYTDATTTATVSIDKATMTVTAVGYTGTYDAAAHEGVVNTTKSMEAETLSYSTDGENYDSAIPTFTNAGAYTVHVKATLANYTDATTTATVSIDKATMTVTAVGYTGTYDAAAHEGIVSTTKSMEAATLLYSTDGENYDSAIPTFTNAGAYTVHVKATLANYTDATTTATVSIDKATMTVTAVGYTGTYDAAAHEGVVNTTKSMEAATLSYSTDGENYDSAIPTFTNAGSYTVYVKATLANYTDAFTTATVSIDPAVLTITAENKTVTFGGTAPANSVTYSGFVAGDDETDLTGDLAYECSYAAGSPVGDYDIMPSGLSSGNYAITFAKGKLTVGQAALTITAENKSVTFGTTAPANSVTYSGFVAGDDATDLTGDLAYECSYAAGSPVGDYDIMPSGLSSGNYAITFAKGKLTVGQAALTVTAENKTVTFGGTAPANSVTYSGFVNGDDAADLTGDLAYDCSYAAGSPVGDYDITPNGLSSGNYAITFTKGKLTVGKAAATITAIALGKVYGQNDPILQATVSGALLEQTLDYTVTRTAGENVGGYPIAIGLGTGAVNDNYDITVSGSIFTISKKAATITVDNKNKVYGETDPTLSAVVTGTVGTETLEYNLNRANGENAGTYAITASLGSGGRVNNKVVTLSVNENYDITVVNGTLTIAPKAASISIADGSKTYGSADPTFSATESGLVGSDTLGYTLNRDAGENAGTYAIKATMGANPNYAVTVFNGTLNITAKAVTITVDNKTMTEGNAVPALSATVVGLVGSDTIEYTLNRAAGTAAGTYAITASYTPNANYAVTVVNGVFTINAAPVNPVATPDNATPTPTNTTIVNPEVPAGGPPASSSTLIPWMLAGGALLALIMLIFLLRKRRQDELA